MGRNTPVSPAAAIVHLLKDVNRFCEHASGLRLRSYQQSVAQAVTASVLQGRGLSFVVMFPRQSGKNELQAQLEAYLMLLFSQTPNEIVKVSPTWKPQSLNAMRRLERVLERNLLTRSLWRKESGYIYRLGQSRTLFFSAQPEANIVGATASTLLEVDEAQEVSIAKYDKDIAPMAAAANATRVFWGTAWTAQTLLGRELRAAQQAEQRDGIRRVFRLSAEDVGREVAAYARFVAEQTARLGRAHPLVRTQYYSEEIDGQGGLFPPERIALMRGGHPPAESPQAGRRYAFLLDVAGEEEGGGDPLRSAAASRRDATALTILQVDLATLNDPLLKAPTYRVQRRLLWTGVKHTRLYAQILALAEHWKPQEVVVDATGIGAGLASFLEKALPGRVTPFIFSAASKSALGWEFLAVVESGRWKEYTPGDDLQALFFSQLEHTQYEIQPGAGRILRWGVPAAARHPLNGEPLHDDLVISAALAAVLERKRWSLPAAPLLIPRPDPLNELDEGY